MNKILSYIFSPLKNFTLLLFLVAVLFSQSVFGATTLDPRKYTNFTGGIGVGDARSSVGTYMAVTGVARIYNPLALTSILVGTNGTTPLADTAITTAGFLCQATGVTNHAAVCFPTTDDTRVLSLSFDVPLNYQSNGALVLGVHTNSTFTAGALSITADVYTTAYDGATITTRIAGTAIQIPTTAGAWFMNITPTVTGFAESISPGTKVTVKLTKACTSNLAQLQLVRAQFAYKPSGALNGR